MSAIPPPSHLSAGAAAYLTNPDSLDYPDSWADPWAVHELRNVTHPLWSSMADDLTIGFDVCDDTIAGVPVERVTSGERLTDTVIVHLHGGMFCLGAPEIDHCINAPLARATGAEVISVDYRLAPEHPFPAGLDDAVAVHEALASAGTSTVVFGESAGGGLAVSLCLALRNAGKRLPRRMALLSPMLDLTGSSDTYRTLAPVDPDYSDTSVLLEPAATYAGTTALDHPLLSPIGADLTGLPDTLIQVGNREVLLGDSTRFTRHARSAGVSVDLHVLDGAWHNYPIWVGVPDAADAQASLAAFLAVDHNEEGSR